MVDATSANPMDASPLASEFRSVINDTTVPLVDAQRYITDPIILFGENYNHCNGALSAMTPSLGAGSSSTTIKRKATSLNENGVHCAAPRNVSPTMPSLSPRRLRHAAASLLASITSSQQSIPIPTPIANPNDRARFVTLPIDDILHHTPVQKKNKMKKGASTVMLGCVPKTEFLLFCRPNHYRPKTSYSDKTIQSDLRGKRRNIMFHFNAPGKKQYYSNFRRW